MRLIPVDSLSDPRLAPYANMRDAELRHREDPSRPVLGEASAGAFMAEGELVVRRLIESPYQVESVLLTSTRLGTLGPMLERLPADTPVFVAAQSVMNEIVGFNMHRGVLAVGLRGREKTVAEITARARTILVLEDLTNHDNLGAMFRNAAALGGPGTALLLSPRCADPLYRKSLRVSVGHVLHVPFARAQEGPGEARWPRVLEHLKRAGFLVLALAPGDGSENILDLERQLAGQEPRRLALLLGTEGAGLTPAALAAADRRVRIAMAPGVDSLNVAVAAAVALHRLVRPEGEPKGGAGTIQ